MFNIPSTDKIQVVLESGNRKTARPHAVSGKMQELYLEINGWRVFLIQGITSPQHTTFQVPFLSGLDSINRCISKHRP